MYIKGFGVIIWMKNLETVGERFACFDFELHFKHDKSLTRSRINHIKFHIFWKGFSSYIYLQIHEHIQSGVQARVSYSHGSRLTQISHRDFFRGGVFFSDKSCIRTLSVIFIEWHFCFNITKLIRNKQVSVDMLFYVPWWNAFNMHIYAHI